MTNTRDDGLRTMTDAECVEIRALLTDLTVAADRMRDGWAEGDEGVKKQLWQNLHQAAEAAYDHVYPL